MEKNLAGIHGKKFRYTTILSVSDRFKTNGFVADRSAVGCQKHLPIILFIHSRLAAAPEYQNRESTSMIFVSITKHLAILFLTSIFRRARTGCRLDRPVHADCVWLLSILPNIVAV